MNTAREILDNIGQLTATEFLSLANALSIEPHTLLRIATPEVPKVVRTSDTLPVPPRPVMYFGGNYSVVLLGIGEKKIQTIKVIREYTGFGLKESKDCVDIAAARRPVPLTLGQNKTEAQKFIRALRDVGVLVALVDDELPF